MAKENSVGVVKTKYFGFEKLVLESGAVLSPVKIAYETYGSLNKEKSNAILICHALSGDSHAAGKHRKNSKKKGWYDIAVGPGKTFDTKKYFIICSNVIGGCRGSTGPASVNPKTGKQYALDFPIISTKDIVKGQKKLIEHLGIEKLFCVTGGSWGGMQALEWIVNFPHAVNSAIIIAAPLKQYPMNLILNDLARKAILNDPEWNKGNYYGKGQPKKGLSLARQIGHVTYVSQENLLRKFDRQKKNNAKKVKFGIDFEVQSYFDYQGKSFVRRFDANSYLYITNAIDNFDITEGGKKQPREIFHGIRPKVLLVSFTSDWLYPPQQVEEIYSGLAEAGVPSVYKKLDLPYGHDSFLIYNNTLGNAIDDFLKKA